MKRALALAIVLMAAAGAWAAGGDTLAWSTYVSTLDDGDTFFVSRHWKPMIDTVQSIVNGRLGNTNLAADADIAPSKIDSAGTLYMRRVTCDSIRGNPDVDSLGGAIVLDTIRGNPDVDSLAGAIVFDTIRGNPDVDSLAGAIVLDTIRGNPDVDSLAGAIVMDSIRGNPDVDSVQGHPYIDTITTARANASDVVVTDSVTAAYVAGVTRVNSADVVASDSIIGVKGSFSSTVQATQLGIGRTPTAGYHLDIATTSADSTTRVLIAANGLNALLRAFGTGVAGTTFDVNTADMFAVTCGSASSMSFGTTNSAPVVLGTNGVGRFTINASGDSLKLSNVTLLAGASTRSCFLDVTADTVSATKWLNIGDYTAIGSATLSTGAFTANQTRMKLATEGAAALDTLVTINGGKGGDILILHTGDSTKDIMIDHAAGNIFLNGKADYTLDNVYDNVVLMKYATATYVYWVEIGRGDVQ